VVSPATHGEVSNQLALSLHRATGQGAAASAQYPVEGSLVDGEQVLGALSVGLVGLGVGAEGVQAGVPEEVGDQDRVSPAA